ncbi:hypothetical protein ACFSDD_09215 [Salipiger marinus]|uniref:hypothetical protein n=1 Tax=Salipiger marinus TaxID=555512 RepID=UPI002BD18F8E|nr:hypothetical protein [Salipiger manganoxidans]MEB3421882.1 hypothetical protein [Salipiger manganoxidans]
MSKPSRTAPKAPPAPALPAPLVLPASGGRFLRDATGALAPAPQPVAPQSGAQSDAPDQKDPEA